MLLKKVDAEILESEKKVQRVGEISSAFALAFFLDLAGSARSA
jgi:hypothetical protein